MTIRQQKIFIIIFPPRLNYSGKLHGFYSKNTSVILKMKFLTLLLLLLSYPASQTVAQTGQPSAEAVELTEKLRMREFSRFLMTPSNIPEKDAEKLEADLGLEAMLIHVAKHLDTSYSKEELSAMLALWENPVSAKLLSEVIGVEAPINRLLSNWTRQRQARLQEIRSSSSKPN